MDEIQKSKGFWIDRKWHLLDLEVLFLLENLVGNIDLLLRLRLFPLMRDQRTISRRICRERKEKGGNGFREVGKEWDEIEGKKGGGRDLR